LTEPRESNTSLGREIAKPAKAAFSFQSLQPVKFASSTADKIDMNPTGFRLELLAQILDTASLRHRVIAQNVANVNTPGYRRMEVSFEADLARAFESKRGESAELRPRVIVADGPERVDGNTVDIDREMNDMAKNALLYQAAAQIVTSRIGSLRAAIAGR
jgi:flagellar basal-body rod protein FlgB